MIPKFRLLLHTVVAATIVTVTAAAQTRSITVREPEYDFGRAVRGAVIEHVFTLVNHGDTPLKIEKLRLTTPLLPSQVPAEIAAHQEATLKVKLDTRTLEGPFEGVVLLSFNDPRAGEVQLAVSGQVVLPVEAVPPILVLTAQRGEEKEVTAEIVNHEVEPLLVDKPDSLSEHVTTRLETIEEGRRLRLTLRLKPDGPAGKNRETIVLKTSSQAVPQLRIAVYTYLRERVYTFPDVVDLGVLRLDDIRGAGPASPGTGQILMVYRKGTSDFQATVSTDVPGLVLNSERGPQGDRYEIVISLAPGKIHPGPIRGSIFVETNDPEFPKLTVPVSGQIEGPKQRSRPSRD